MRAHPYRELQTSVCVLRKAEKIVPNPKLYNFFLSHNNLPSMNLLYSSLKNLN